MDKYEYKLSSEEIKRLIAEGDYAKAAEIADTIDWRRVKSVMMLCKISDLYKINRRYEDARDLLLLAYDRRPGGRAICYSLCELSIKMEEFVQALEYYKEFVQVAPRDTGRYILQYKLYEAQDVSLEERIAVLEELKKRDYRERWAYELAYLYHRIGLATRCVEECDELILWFGDGKYVIKAMELKMLHEPLTPQQQCIYDNRFKRDEEVYESAAGEEAAAMPEAAQEESEEAYSGEELEGQPYGPAEEEVAGEEIAGEAVAGEEAVGEEPAGELSSAEPTRVYDSHYTEAVEAALAMEKEGAEAALPEEEELDIQVKTMDVSQYNTINLQKELAEGLKEVLEEGAPEAASSEAEGGDAAGGNPDGEYVEAGYPEEGYAEEEYSQEGYAEEGYPEEGYAEEGYPEEGYVEGEYPEEGYAEEGAPEEGYTEEGALEEGYAEEGAREEGYPEEPSQEADAEPAAAVEEGAAEKAGAAGAASLAELGTEAAGTENAGKEEPIQEVPLPRELEEVLSMESDGQISLVVPDEVKKQEQVEGQISLRAMIAARKFGEDKAPYGKPYQYVVEKPVEEAKEPAEAYEEGPAEDVQEVEEVYEEASAEEAEEPAEEAEEAEEPVEGVQGSEEDYGEKPADDGQEVEEVYEEASAEEAEEPAEEAEEPVEDVQGPEEAYEEAVARALEEVAEEEWEVVEKAAKGLEDAAPKGQEAAEGLDEGAEDAAATRGKKRFGWGRASAKSVAKPAKGLAGQDKPGAAEEDGVSTKEEKSGKGQAADDGKADGAGKEAAAESAKQEKATVERDQARVRDLTKEEVALFDQFLQNKEDREKLVKALDSISLAAYTGNVVVTGDEGMDTYALAKNIVCYVQISDTNFSGKTAKITGASLKREDVSKILDHLKNGALIIQKASGMETKVVGELFKYLQYESIGIIVILEDSKRAMNKFLTQHKKLAECFNARIDLEALDNDALAEFGKEYAHKQEYAIDEMAMLALHTRIQDMQSSDHAVTVAEVKGIVDDAIHHANRKTLKHFCDVVLAKRYDEEDMIILREKDFTA